MSTLKPADHHMVLSLHCFQPWMICFPPAVNECDEERRTALIFPACSTDFADATVGGHNITEHPIETIRVVWNGKQKIMGGAPPLSGQIVKSLKKK
jgi:hypothetical protein